MKLSVRSVVLMSGVFLFSISLSGDPKKPCKWINKRDEQEKYAHLLSKEMEYGKICKDAERCITLSRLVLGTDHLGKIDKKEREAVLKAAVEECGITAFDTSPIYVNGIESKLGDWLKGLKRNDLVTISKGGFPFDLGPGTYKSRLTGTEAEMEKNILEELEATLTNLPYIDIYLMHRDDINFKDFVTIQRYLVQIT